MEANVIVGNIVALIASIIMVYSGFIKDKKKIVFIQTIQIFLLVVSNLVLGGITGAIINVISCIRNILCYKDKLDLKAKIIITVLSIVLSVVFNNLAFAGLLPLIATTIYVWFMNEKNIIKFKILMIVTAIMWFIYDIVILSYTSAIFDFLTAVAAIIAIIQILKKIKKSE